MTSPIPSPTSTLQSPILWLTSMAMTGTWVRRHGFGIAKLRSGFVAIYPVPDSAGDVRFTSRPRLCSLGETEEFFVSAGSWSDACWCLAL